MLEKLLPADCYSRHRLIAPEGIVIHYFSAIYWDKGGPDVWGDPQVCWNLFRELKLSAHFMIDRNGTIYRLVPEDHQAWHAGKSEWNGRTSLNQWYFGIEFIATKDSGFTSDQYAAGQMLVAQLMSQYGIKLENVVGHDQVAPGRKVDPGKLFDWHRFKGSLKDVV